ncbi:MAG: peroxiredoxin family protein [Planctomycetota bacterium]
MDHHLLNGRRWLLAMALTSLIAACAGPGSATAPDVDHRGATFVDVDGVTHRLEQPTVFVFWQPWCKACREEAPEAVAASVELGGEMAFVGVVSGPDEAVDGALFDQSVDELGLTYPQVRDRDLALTRRFDVRSTPMVVMVGGDGRVRYRGSNLPRDWSQLR